MKINKFTALLCAVIVLGSGIVIPFIDQEQTVIIGLVSGIFTGFIVSLVVAIIGYLHEKAVIIEKIDANIKSVYINMSVISKLLGRVLPQIYKAEELLELPFANFSGLSALNIDLFAKMNLGMFSPILKIGEMADWLSGLHDYEQVIYSTRNFATGLQCMVLEYNILFKQYQISKNYGNPISPSDIQSLTDKKNVINIRTAKFHEYTTGKVMELEKIAKLFYQNQRKKYSWKDVQAYLTMQIEEIVKG